MKRLKRGILEQLVAGTAEPLLVARIDSPDWPVVFCNPAFEDLAGTESVRGRPLADVIEQLLGRELALEISESIRSGQETTIPLELRDREYLLALKPLSAGDGAASRFCGAYWRLAAGAPASAGSELHQALLKAKRRIRDLSRDDPVTGLLNARAFSDVLAHDWAVAAREKTSLALVAFTLDDFDAYVEVFGRHAAESCQRRVAQAVRRCLRRASDVAARIEDGTDVKLLVLSHASEEAGVHDFAARISTAVRELGLHHPRSTVAKYVTVSYRISLVEAGGDGMQAVDFLAGVMEEATGD